MSPTALRLCRRIGAALAWAGWTIHTGGAPGAHTAFAAASLAVEATWTEPPARHRPDVPPPMPR